MVPTQQLYFPKPDFLAKHRSRFSLGHRFSDFTVQKVHHLGLLKLGLLEPEFLIQMLWGKAGERESLVSSLVMFLPWHRGYIVRFVAVGSTLHVSMFFFKETIGADNPISIHRALPRASSGLFPGMIFEGITFYCFCFLHSTAGSSRQPKNP